MMVRLLKMVFDFSFSMVKESIIVKLSRPRATVL
jgi:hypothetical protein